MTKKMHTSRGQVAVLAMPKYTCFFTVGLPNIPPNAHPHIAHIFWVGFLGRHHDIVGIVPLLVNMKYAGSEVVLS